MALGAAGLQTHIWNNNIRSMYMLAAYPLLIMAMIWVCIYSVVFAFYYSDVRVDTFGMAHYAKQVLFYANDLVAQSWPFVTALVVLWFAIAYLMHEKMILQLSGAHSILRTQEPELYNLLENLCISQGVPMPKLNIIETHGRNAFASGINQDTYAITVTRGLMNSLAKDELEAVLAHELAHIMNRDVRLMVVAVIFTGMVGVALQMTWNALRYSPHMASASRNGRGGGKLIIGLLAIMAILAVGYYATAAMRFFISRKREYMADAVAVDITKNPSAMMRALMRIAGRDLMPTKNGDIAMMYIENSKRFMGLWHTHPPIEKRIEALAVVNNIEIPDIKSLGPAAKEDRLVSKSKPPATNPWMISKRHQ